MLIHIAKKEILEHVKSFRFLVAFLFILATFFLMVFARNSEYRSQHEDYLTRLSAQEDALEKYANANRINLIMQPVVQPSSMEILVEPAVTGTAIDSAPGFDDDPLKNIILKLDMIGLIGLLGSILALLLSYDSINREVGEGTLRLLQSTGVPRIKIVVGKILGGSLAATLPVAVIFALAALWLAVAGGWGAGHWVAFLGIFLVSMIYIMLFYCLGAFLSSVILDQTLSALSCFGLWVLLIIVVPTLSPLVAQAIVKVPDSGKIQREVNYIDSVEREQAIKDKVLPIMVEQNISFEEAWQVGKLDELNAFYFEKIGALKASLRNASANQMKLSIRLSCVSPYAAYFMAVEELSGLGFSRLQYLGNVISNYSQKFDEYKTLKFNQARAENPAFSWGDKLDLSGAPRFRYTDPGPSYVYSHALPYMLLLVAYFLIPLFLYLHSFTTKRAALRIAFSILFVGMFSAYVYSQGAGGQDQATLLYHVKQAEILVNTMRMDFEAKERMHKEGLVSGMDFELAKNKYRDARLNYVYALIRATSGSFYVSLEKAVKYQKPDGTKWVKLTLLNSLPDLGKTIDEFLGTGSNEDVGNYKELYNNEIRNVFLSIEKDDIIAGQPLEYKINSLSFGERRDFDFQIMRDMDEVVVCLRYDLMTVERRKVHLMPSNAASKLALTPGNFSVEANLGDKAVYKVALERYMTGAGVVKLGAPDLPPQFQYDIHDGATRVSDINFKENDFKKDLTLNVHLPTRESKEVVMDKPVEFTLVATEQTSSEGKPRTLEGSTRLVLVPKGIGKIEVKADNLFQESSGSNPVKIPIRIVNDGSRDVLDVSLTIRGGVGWENTCSPMTITSLKLKEEGIFNVVLTPPENVHPGEYDFKVAIKGQSDGKTVYADEKTFRVKVSPRTNWVVILLGTVLALGLIGGAAYGAVRIMKN